MSKTRFALNEEIFGPFMQKSTTTDCATTTVDTVRSKLLAFLRSDQYLLLLSNAMRRKNGILYEGVAVVLQPVHDVKCNRSLYI